MGFAGIRYFRMRLPAAPQLQVCVQSLTLNRISRWLPWSAFQTKSCEDLIVFVQPLIGAVSEMQ